MQTVIAFGSVGGGLLTVLGALGFAVTGVADPLNPQGQHLLLLEVNPAQNVLHLGLGLSMVVAAAGSWSVARTWALVASSALGMLGLLGLALTGPGGNPLALNGWGNLLHLGLAVWGTLVVVHHRDPSPGMEAPQ